MLNDRKTKNTFMATAAWFLAFCCAAPSFAAGYEKAGKVKAAKYLPAEAMAGEEWKVAAEASNDGAINTYVIESRFGNFDAVGRAHVAVRAREVEALAELERVSKTDVFVDAVKESALGSVETVVSFVQEPVETVKAIPKGLGRWFKKTKFQVEEVYVDIKESKEEIDREKAEQEALDASGDSEAAEARKEDRNEDLKDKSLEAAGDAALSYLRISGAERAWYAELGVDPYTDNEPLRSVIKSYSRIDGLTGFGMRFVGVYKIPGAREIGKVMDLVWGTDPWELRQINRDKLIAAGLSEDLAREFEDNPNLSLTQQTLFLQILDDLKGVQGRQHLIARAIDLTSKREGQILFQSTGMLLRHHRGTRPLVEILAGVKIPVARSAGGQLVVALPADALFWTEEIAQGASDFYDFFEKDPSTVREVWVVGQASDRFKDESKKQGWKVFDRWKVLDKEDAGS